MSFPLIRYIVDWSIGLSLGVLIGFILHKRKILHVQQYMPIEGIQEIKFQGMWDYFRVTKQARKAVKSHRRAGTLV